jgi:sarcosine oxidase delta subunit
VFRHVCRSPRRPTKPWDANARSCRRYFKVDVGALIQATRLWCPYCGTQANRDEFMTLDQRRRVRSAAQRLALEEASRVLEEAFRPLERRLSGPIRFRFERGRVEIPPLLTYLEKETVRQKVCGTCGGRCAVYGIAVVCPVCGGRDPLEMFLESLEAARACLLAVSDLPADRRWIFQASGGEERLAENALSDTVTAFEAYCKARYEEVTSAAALQTLLRRRGQNVLQRLDDAVPTMETALGRTVASALTTGERRELAVAFATRHVLTHSFGISDARYRAAGGTTPLGERVQVTRTTAEHALRLTERLVGAMS